MNKRVDPVPKHQARKTYRGSEVEVPHILDPGTRWRWVVNFKLQLLYPFPIITG